MATGESRHRAWHSVHHGFPLGLRTWFGSFGGVPEAQRLIGVGSVLVAKDMRVTPHQLVGLLAADILKSEFAVVLSNLAVQKHLQEQVAQFLAHLREVAGLHGGQELGGLLHEVLFDGVVSLRQVPRAAPLWVTELFNYINKPF